MSVINAVPLLAAAGGDYTISRSVRLRSSASAYFSRTFGTPTNNLKWTWSGWVKRGKLGTAQTILGGAAAGTGQIPLYFTANDQLAFYDSDGVSTYYQIGTTAVFRDPSAWYHIVIVFDSANATQANRLIIYANNVSQALSSIGGSPGGLLPLNRASYWNASGAANNIGCYYTSSTANNPLDGYLTEINFIDGQALTPSSFGENDTVTGVWKPKKYAGTYGTNGFYLNFSDNSNNTAATIGKDYSGNGNNWTPNNISVTSGTTYDSMLDVPTPYADGGNGRGNYAVLNPLDQHGTSSYATVADGNLYWYGSYNTQNGHGIRSTLRVPPTGKWYVEASNVTYSGSGNSCMLGFTSSTQPITNSAFGGTLTPWIGVDASVFNNTVSLSSNGASASPSSGTLFASCASGDIINLAIDFDAGKFWVGKNGTWYNSGDPAAGTNATSTFTAGSAEWTFWAEYVAASTNTNRSSAVANFGQRPFSYTPPSGFKALNTQNLPAPTISNGALYMAATTYTGNGGTQSIANTVNGVSFKPDLVWIKTRSATSYHQLIDSVRGVSTVLNSNYTGAESSYPGYSVTAFNSNGFTVVDDAAASYGVNGSTGSPTYVGWQWQAGKGTTSSNTNGSITSTVSVNATAGFSVVTYTGTGANATVGHGLGVAPSMIIIKNRTLGTENWAVYHTSTGAAYWLLLSGTNAAINNTTIWQNTSPTSSVMSLGPISNSNVSGSNFVAYCFSAVAGYSAFGSYTGNGSATGDGPFVFCGFRPRWVMIKKTNATSNWSILDTARDDFNVADNPLLPNTSGAETTSTSISGAFADVLSNGFKLRGNSGDINDSGATYIYAAFSETAFKFSLAR